MSETPEPAFKCAHCRCQRGCSCCTSDVCGCKREAEEEKDVDYGF